MVSPNRSNEFNVKNFLDGDEVGVFFFIMFKYFIRLYSLVTTIKKRFEVTAFNTIPVLEFCIATIASVNFSNIVYSFTFKSIKITKLRIFFRTIRSFNLYSSFFFRVKNIFGFAK